MPTIAKINRPIVLTIVPIPVFGALLGKLAADIVFYLPTILSYELLSRSSHSDTREAS